MQATREATVSVGGCLDTNACVDVRDWRTTQQPRHPRPRERPKGAVGDPFRNADEGTAVQATREATVGIGAGVGAGASVYSWRTA